MGISIVDLTQREITEAVLEMEARLSGYWVENPKDAEVQKCFWKELRDWPTYWQYHGWVHPNARIGAHYLRRSSGWLLG